MSGIPIDTPEWWLLFHEGDRLAGWCTQIMSEDSIREEEIPQLVAFPTLDVTGPYAAWIADIHTQKPLVFAYVRNLEQMRLALLKQIGAA